MRSRVALLRTVVGHLSDSKDYTLDGIHRAVEFACGRRIEIKSHAFEGGTSVCGVWFRLPSHDLVIHAQTPSPLHRQQIVLHELAHIVMRHHGSPGIGDRVGNLFSTLSPTEVAHAVRTRSDYTDPEELEAEWLADKFSMLILRGPLLGGSVMRHLLKASL